VSPRGGRLLFAGAVLALIAALVLFKVRVAVAGGKYLLLVLVILAGVWLLTRRR
jgi:hypothetical protein